jgi:Tol biopolymer transport system component
VTLDDTALLPLAMRINQGQQPNPPATTDQVFLRHEDGSVSQLTDPWTEDWRDGVRAGDVRSNTDPWYTPDGRALVVTNRSSLTGESFLLRIDLATGAVLNLTNATSGALPVVDAGGSVSPDGRSVAFSWTQGDQRDMYLMDAATGASVHAVTSSGDAETASAWLPDGSAVVYLRHRDGGDVVARTTVTADRGTAAGPTVLGGAGTSPATPVVDPAGAQVLFVGTALGNRSVYRVDPLGRAAPGVLQPDTQDNVFFVDWR